MVGLFQSFGSSQMPKRLLRYALARFDLLDESTLDMENLDFALGKSTVLEFRDVGIKLPKLEKLLQLPPALKLQKSQAAVLRVTIPIDFFSGSIIVEVDGVDVSVNVLDPDIKADDHKATDSSNVVPNPVDLAQSFLESQPSTEKKRLEEALAAETHDLAASHVSFSDDSSDDDAVGTGQALSLPAFLAGFLQGIVDRMQVKIKGVALNLNVVVPVDPASPHPEPVSFQIALDNIDVEGLTARSRDSESGSTIKPKDGKRHISLNRVRAYLITEANIFSNLAQSPSMAPIPSPLLSKPPSFHQGHGHLSQQPSTNRSQEYSPDVPQDILGLLSGSNLQQRASGHIHESFVAHIDGSQSQISESTTTLRSQNSDDAMPELVPIRSDSRTGARRPSPQSPFGQCITPDLVNLSYNNDVEFQPDSFHSSMGDLQEATRIIENIQGLTVSSPSNLGISADTMNMDIPTTEELQDSFHSSMGSLREIQGLQSGNMDDSVTESALDQSFRSSLSDPESESPTDSQGALGIPNQSTEREEFQDGEGPATPRASVYHGFDESPEQSMFHSTILPRHNLAQTTAFETDVPLWASAHSQARSEPTMRASTPTSQPVVQYTPNAIPHQPLPGSLSSLDSAEDLSQSQLYTHEEAESMYMSAFSTESPQIPSDPASADDGSFDLGEAMFQSSISQRTPTIHQSPSPVRTPSRPVSPFETSLPPPEVVPTRATPSLMPGAWDDSFNSSASVDSSASAAKKTVDSAKGEENATSLGQIQDQSHQKSTEEQDADGVTNKDSHAESDEAFTPKGPTKLVREILSLDRISFYVPSNLQSIRGESEAAESMANLAESMGRSIGPYATGSLIEAGGTRGRSDGKGTETNQAGSHSVEIDLSPVSFRFDLSLGYLLAVVAGKVLSAIKPEPLKVPEEKDNHQEENSANIPDLAIRVEQISLDFINQLTGIAGNADRITKQETSIPDHEVLLNATFKHLEISISSKELDDQASKKEKDVHVKQKTMVTQISLESFRFGYEKGDILSFDKAMPLSTSVRDTFLSSGWDIGMRIVQTIGGDLRTDVETLPLAVHIDLQRLDETFSWFGGLNSFLNMSASVTSNATSIAKASAPPASKPRGVRFDVPDDHDQISEKQASLKNKINFRIGGASITLQGKDCSVKADSSAVKLISRDEAIGVSIRKLRAAGPFLRSSRAAPPIIVDVGDARLDLLMTPGDQDLERLLELIMPSKARFDEDNDEIMVDTLLRQRRKGSVLRANIESVNIRVKNIAELVVIPGLGEELAKLSTVAKYLPEDDRPGLLTLARVQKVSFGVDSGNQLGHFDMELEMLDLGHISVPSLLALSASSVSVKRNQDEELIGSSASGPMEVPRTSPAIMIRMIGDEIEPTIKFKLHNLAVEYRVPFIMDFLGLGEDATPQDFEASLAASVADLGEHAQKALRQPDNAQKEKSQAAEPANPMTLNVGFHDCLLGLNPLNLSSKMILALSDAKLDIVLPDHEQTKVDITIKKAFILLIDDVKTVSRSASHSRRRRSSSPPSIQVLDMCSRGFVNICHISSAHIAASLAPGEDGESQVDVQVQDDLIVLETCADSTQTLITLVNALKPPTPPSKEEKYRTNVMPVTDLLASITAEAFGNPEGEYDFDQDFAGAQELAGSGSDLGSIDEMHYISQNFASQPQGEAIFDAMESSAMSDGTLMQDTAEGVLLTGTGTNNQFSSIDYDDSDDELVIHEDFYKKDTQYDPNAKVWNWNKSQIDRAPREMVARSPFKIAVRDVQVKWHLFDGYDWPHTREVIAQAVQDVENRAIELRSGYGGDGGAVIYEEEIDIMGDEGLGDCLFNSIYIGIASGRDPHDLTGIINTDLNDNATETESIVTTAYTGASNRTARTNQSRGNKLRLNRSRHHKITFDLRGVNADVIVFPLDEQKTQSNISVRVTDIEVLDHVPTSTWNKFATYDQDSGEREMGSSMVQLDMLNVKPMPEVASSEIVLKVSVLPLRLHVDQDALDFIVRFFEFKDDSIPVHASANDVPFIMRAEILDIPVSLDFKPKRVDYTGLRSGRTTEMMNFVIMEEARMVLRHVVIHGTSGFDKMGKVLNDVWMDNVKRNQLPTVLAGLAPVRSIVNIGNGFRDLVEIPIREYRKDGRVIRGVQKGAAAFARNTGTELVKLGAKLAVGTQYALEGAENMLTDGQHADNGWDYDEIDPEEQRLISLYADQPPSVMQGLRGGYRCLARDMNTMKNVIIAVPGEVMQSQGPKGAAKAILKRTPTIIFRPVVGVSKAIGQTLKGATNSMDPHHQRRIEQKYKRR